MECNRRLPRLCRSCIRIVQSSRYQSTIANTSDSSPPVLLTLQPQTLHSYQSTAPPTLAQLNYACKFFLRANNKPATSHSFSGSSNSSTPQAPPGPQVLWSSPYFRTIPTSSYPEICFLGRSNVGKSSLLNALFGRPRLAPAHVSKRPGRTRTMNAFAVGAVELGVRSFTPRSGATSEESKRSNGGGEVFSYGNVGSGEENTAVIVVDMPGYGAASREEWGTEIMKYLQGRKQLKRTFVLIDAEHGLKKSDKSILEFLAQNGISHQVLLSKVDKILHPRAKMLSPKQLSNRLEKLRGVLEGLQEELKFGKNMTKSVGDIISCSGVKELDEYGIGKGKIGIDAIRWAMLSACGLECNTDGTHSQGRYYDVLSE